MVVFEDDNSAVVTFTDKDFAVVVERNHRNERVGTFLNVLVSNSRGLDHSATGFLGTNIRLT